MTLPAPTLATTAATRDSIRVLVVDDSVVIRGLLGRWIGEAEGMVSVGAARNGRQGVEMVEALKPDVAGDIVYLCGNPDMVDQSFSLLKEIGLPVPHVRREKYISSR